MPGPPDLEPFLHLDVALRVPLQRVIDAETYFNRLIRAVGRSVVGSDDPWERVTAEANGVVSLRVTPVVSNDRVEDASRIVDAVALGIAELERTAERPPHFSDEALEFARELALLSAELKQVGIRNGTVGSPVTQNIANNATALLTPEFEEYGSVEGTILGVDFHAKNRYFSLYDALDEHRIRCNFGTGVDPDDVRDALLSRVLVTGIVSYRTAGVATAVAVEGLSPFPDEERLPSADEVRGILR